MLSNALGLGKEQSPFPWQESFIGVLLGDNRDRLTLDVPTGLGKTSVMAAWLVALAEGADLPRRLVYIVDRRAVVDQATREAVRLRRWVEQNSSVKKSLGLGADVELPISTLRGQFADNREWLRDPAAPAIVVGTVDMIGSRLLFEGYGVSRKMRPYHAGFLGSDTLFVLDEAHLVPPFEELLKSVVGDNESLKGVNVKAPKVIPRTMLLSLSATGRTDSGDVIRIGEKDFEHPEAGKRLTAKKRLSFVVELEESKPIHERLADEAWAISDQGDKPVRVIVFSNSRDVAQKAKDALFKLAKTAGREDVPTELFVGARRVRERQQVESWLETHGFLAGNESSSETAAFVFATSAGEVGVDMDADHMVGDLVAFERMIQRFGRVNRRGEGDAKIKVLLEREEPTKEEQKSLAKALAKSSRERNRGEHDVVRQFDLAIKYRKALKRLPGSGDEYDASPDAFRQLKEDAEKDPDLDALLNAATTPNPLRPELTRPILDSWSMTSLGKHSARPIVAPWLRGWVEDDAQTTVVWRRYLPSMSPGCSDTRIRQFFENAPIHLTEKLETRSDVTVKWLLDRVKKLDSFKKKDAEFAATLPAPDDIVAILLGNGGDVVDQLSFDDLRFDGGKEVQSRKKNFERQVRNQTLVVDARLGGLSSGLLETDGKDSVPTPAADDLLPHEWIDVGEADAVLRPIPGFRISVRKTDEESDPVPNCTVAFQLPIPTGDEDEASRVLTVWKYRNATTSEDSRSSLGEQGLDDHHSQTEAIAAEFAQRLKLPSNLALALRIAARNHDHGKNCELWQNAFSAPENGRPYAKTNGPLRVKNLHRYRHEFGSLPQVTKDPEFNSLDSELQDLVMHLVAAHHGFARPTIRTSGCTEPPSVLEDRARDVALRFARLQKEWGPWGLAWLESLLRAADHKASSMIADEGDTAVTNSQEELNHG